MKGKNFELKISDLLNHLGTDTIEFEGMKTRLVPNLMEEGMSGNLKLHSLDGESVLVTLEDFECGLADVCDSCGAEFLRNVCIEEYVARFALNAKELENSDEEVFFVIDKKSDTINVEEMLYQAILLQEPFVKKCATCASQPVENEEEDGGTVIWKM